MATYTVACSECGQVYDADGPSAPDRCGACGHRGIRTIEHDDTPLFPATIGRGPAILVWLLSGAEGYGSLTDRDLRLADASAILAVAPRDCHPSALDAVSRVRARIARTLDARTRARAGAPAAQDGATDEITPAPDPYLEAVTTLAGALLRARNDRHDDDSGDGGRPVRRPIVPPSGPPPASVRPVPPSPVPVPRATPPARDPFGF